MHMASIMECPFGQVSSHREPSAEPWPSEEDATITAARPAAKPASGTVVPAVMRVPVASEAVGAEATVWVGAVWVEAVWPAGSPMVGLIHRCIASMPTRRVRSRSVHVRDTRVPVAEDRWDRGTVSSRSFTVCSSLPSCFSDPSTRNNTRVGYTLRAGIRFDVHINSRGPAPDDAKRQFSCRSPARMPFGVRKLGGVCQCGLFCPLSAQRSAGSGGAPG